MSSRERAIVAQPVSGETKVAETLGPQLGTDGVQLSKGLIDQRKYAVLTPLQQLALAHFDYRGNVQGNRYFARLTDFILNSSPSLHGRGRQDTIELAAAASGSRSVATARKPGWFTRNVTDRDWQKKAEQQGKVVEE